MQDYMEKWGYLEEGESRSLLRHLVEEIQDAAKHDEEKKYTADEILKLLDSGLTYRRELQREWEEQEKNVHIMFSQSDAGSMKVTLSNLNRRHECAVLAFNDVFSVGPIQHLHTGEGQRRRTDWMQNRVNHYIFNQMHNREHQIAPMMKTLAKIEEHKSIFIWCANNAHDQTGLRFAAYLLRERKQPIHVINVSEAYRRLFGGDDVEIPYFQGQIEPDQFQEIIRDFEQTQPLSSEARKQYEAEWLELSSQEHCLRLLRNGQIVGVPEDELDVMILEILSELQSTEAEEDGYVPAGQLSLHFYNQTNQLIDNEFLSYRVWSLISDGQISFKGLPVGWYTFSIRRS
ncbi:DUF1835 domain-containing protein [Paenibacillus jiagnxiensis]|uniref:DUF1835 domain-containing protein n=1 Tax=Paenibacillus jiagnxiensis TaxID=3228926 RepID=UPI0033A36D1A